MVTEGSREAAVRSLLETMRRCGQSVRLRDNLFHLTRTRDDEVIHSRFVAWMCRLDPAFVRAVARAATPPAEVDPGPRYRVVTEFVGSRSIADIVVSQPGSFVLLVENKIWAPERQGQCSDEYLDLMEHAERMEVPAIRSFPLFLTPEGFQPTTAGPAQPWRTISYADLARAFRGAAESVALSDHHSALIDDWCDAIPRRGLEG